MRWLDGITDSMDMILTKFWKVAKDREAWRAVVHGVAKSQTSQATEQQQGTRDHMPQLGVCILQPKDLTCLN